MKQDIYRQANQQIIQYSDSLSSQSVELTKAQGEAAQSSDTADAVAKQAEEEQKRSQSYEALFNAYTAMQQDDLDTAALELQKVYVDTLSDSAKGIYNTISGKTGVSGVESGASDGTSGDDSSTDGTAGADAAASDGEDTQSSDGDIGEDSSYSDGGYEDSSYDGSYTE